MPVKRVIFHANDLQHQAEQLREQMLKEGYLFIRGLFAREKIRRIRLQVLDLFRQEGCLTQGTEWEDGLLRSRNEIPESTVSKIRSKAFGLEAVHALWHSQEILDVMRILIQEEVVPHIHKQVRFQFKAEEGRPSDITASHQDYIYNQGAEEVYSCWTPLGDLSQKHGVLQVLPGSHLQGLYEVHAPAAGSITYSIDDRGLEGEWFSPDYQMGDVMIFHSYTVHRAPANESDYLRLSTDCRFQGISQPFSRELIKPLPGVLESYPQWSSQELQRYWEQMDLRLVDHDYSFLDRIKANGK